MQLLAKAQAWNLSTYNNPTGTKSDPKITAGIRISGSALPPFFFAN
jgi:hypothetical protein